MCTGERISRGSDMLWPAPVLRDPALRADQTDQIDNNDSNDKSNREGSRQGLIKTRPEIHGNIPEMHCQAGTCLLHQPSTPSRERRCSDMAIPAECPFYYEIPKKIGPSELEAPK